MNQRYILEKALLDNIVLKTPYKAYIMLNDDSALKVYIDGTVFTNSSVVFSMGFNPRWRTCSTISIDGHKLHMSVGRLVALVFHGLPETDDLVIHYIDGNRRNNSAFNIEWATRSYINKVKYINNKFKEAGYQLDRPISVKEYRFFEKDCPIIKYNNPEQEKRALEYLYKLVIRCAVNVEEMTCESFTKQDDRFFSLK